MAVPCAILIVSFIFGDESVMCASVALMLNRKPVSCLSIAFGETLAEASNVYFRAIMKPKFSAAIYCAFDPLAYKSVDLSHKFTNAVHLIELEVSFIRVFIALLHYAMAMPQAILELTNVDLILRFVDTFTEAIADSCFPFADISLTAIHTHVRYFPEAVHFFVNHFAFISYHF